MAKIKSKESHRVLKNFKVKGATEESDFILSKDILQSQIEQFCKDKR